MKIQYDTANDGQEAYEMVKEKHRLFNGSYKLIMMDYSMPRLSGPAATRKILDYLHSKASTLAKPYICCCTAYTNKSFREEALKSGMDDFYVKLTSKNQFK